jgi:hypothetical protein
MTRAEQRLLGGRHPGRHTMCGCGGLVVEDQVALANLIGESPPDAGFAVDVVYRGAAAPDTTTSTRGRPRPRPAARAR